MGHCPVSDCANVPGVVGLNVLELFGNGSETGLGIVFGSDRSWEFFRVGFLNGGGAGVDILNWFAVVVGVGVVVAASWVHGFSWLYLLGGLGWAGVAWICSLLVIRIISPWP